ncbi:YraN family protein [Rathayibacter sp. YIM 133350]|uniref:YraN family protein n=1 Tax=Rathayibacter sp. YIM 133350 TaxID=3131992 RepID=UPI00307CF470
MAAKDDLGRWGEDLAADYLRQHGYRVLERNWRCRQGEIDVVAEHDGEIVFVEVKTRSSLAYGHPFEAITLGKLARMRRLALAWCVDSGRHHRIRLDAIAIVAPRDTPVSIEHLVRLS